MPNILIAFVVAIEWDNEVLVTIVVLGVILELGDIVAATRKSIKTAISHLEIANKP